METIFKNEADQISRENEISKDGNYSKIILSNNEIIQEEIFENGVLSRITVFIDGNQNHDSILKNDTFLGNYILVGERKTIGDFKYEKVFDYGNSHTLKSIYTVVCDKHGNHIAHSYTEDLVNEIPYWNATKKYYFDSSIRPNGSLFECVFDDDGKLIPITIEIEELNMGDHDGTWIYDDEDGIEELMQITGMSKELAQYYLSTEIIPNFN